MPGIGRQGHVEAEDESHHVLCALGRSEVGTPVLEVLTYLLTRARDRRRVNGLQFGGPGAFGPELPLLGL